MRCVSTVIIDRPVRQVWDFFDNPANMTKWLTGFQEFMPVSGTQGEIGATAIHVYDNNGKRLELLEEIIEKVPYERFAGTLTHPGMESTMETVFTDLSDGRTKVVSITDTKIKGCLFRIIAPMVKRGFQRRQNADLDRLREVIEREIPVSGN